MVPGMSAAGRWIGAYAGGEASRVSRALDPHQPRLRQVMQPGLPVVPSGSDHAPRRNATLQAPAAVRASRDPAAVAARRMGLHLRPRRPVRQSGLFAAAAGTEADRRARTALAHPDKRHRIHAGRLPEDSHAAADCERPIQRGRGDGGNVHATAWRREGLATARR